MRSSSLSVLGLLALTTATVASPSDTHVLLARDYLNDVCSPNITTADSTIPPCTEIATIEEACTVNGTSPLDIGDHAMCMCEGSYFQDWQGCQDCLYFHGFRSERDEAFYESVKSIASQSLCGYLSGSVFSEPTAVWASLFSSVAATLSQLTTGATVLSDQAPSQTAVSLYFTASGTQGPGATPSVFPGGSSSSKTSQTTSGKSSSSSKTAMGTASGSAAATSSSGSGAYPAKAPGGLLVGLAGAVLAVGL